MYDICNMHVALAAHKMFCYILVHAYIVFLCLVVIPTWLEQLLFFAFPHAVSCIMQHVLSALVYQVLKNIYMLW